MTSKELKIIGVMLYVCEGTKLRKDPRYKNTFIYSIEFTNSDPRIINLFLKFMRRELKVDPKRIKAQLFIYPDLSKKLTVKYWSKTTKIPTDQFQKVIVLKKKITKFKHNPLGTFKIRYSSKDSFLKLQSIIDRFWKSARVV